MANQDHSIKGKGYGNVYLDALIKGGAGWNENSGPITWYLADADDVAEGLNPRASQYRSWTDAERAAFQLALENYSSVSKLKFVEADDAASADIVEWKVPQSYIQSHTGQAATAYHEFPDGIEAHANPNQQWGFFSFDQVSNTAPTAGQNYIDYMYRGGTGLQVFTHELGHGLGLNHPFLKNSERFPGVRAGNDEDLGTNHETQTPFTIMSYNQWWDEVARPDFTYGRMGTLGALDIAAIQAIYGKNTSWHKGNDVYTLPTANARGASWACIWDAGGIDTIDNSASNISSTIDLRAATLLQGPNAGGYISSNDGIQGGLTIANGVVIENAKGGSKADLIVGNDANNSLVGNGGDDSLSGRGGADELYGGAGHDSLVGGTGDDVYLLYDLQAGRYDTVFEKAGEGTDLVCVWLIDSSVTSYTLGANIENGAVTSKSGSFTLIGNDQDNKLWGDYGDDTLKGGNGDDMLHGSLGVDVLVGGEGSDLYYLPDINAPMRFSLFNYDTVIEDPNAAGIDKIIVTALDNPDTFTGVDGYILPDAIEEGEIAGDIAFDLTGNALNNYLTGNGSANVLWGLEGRDRLSGGGGRDELHGGAGDDFYFLNDLTAISLGGEIVDTYDTVIEEANEGIDTVGIVGISNPRASAPNKYVLGANLENGTIYGTQVFDLTGNTLDNALTGNSAANTLEGLAGEDTLRGGGGHDELYGGKGNDTYFLADLSLTRFGPGFLSVYDSVFEGAGGGTDTVVVTAFANPNGSGDRYGYALEDEVENGTIVGVRAFDLLGNRLKNTLKGNAAANELDGGAGADTLIGGAGNDSYVVDNAGDKVVERAGEGIDTVTTTVSLVLAANVENLTLAGTANLSATGNVLSNTIFGNAGNNRIDGLGGDDLMRGGDGNDSYVVDNTHDRVIEGSGDNSGTDTVTASASYTLAANVEKLVLSGTADIAGTGNTARNSIVGNAGDNVLDGKLGNDTLTGGAGKDTFAFSTALGATNVDRIMSYSVADDRIQLDNAVFTKLVGTGTLSANQFKDITASGTKPDADDRILYNHDTGVLYYDADGSGAGAAVKFAVLDNEPLLSAREFFIV